MHVYINNIQPLIIKPNKWDQYYKIMQNNLYLALGHIFTLTFKYGYMLYYFKSTNEAMP